MKVSVEEDKSLHETIVAIRCAQHDEEIDSLIALLSSHNKILIGQKDSELLRIPIGKVLYIESVDKRTFAYTHAEVFQIGQRLYEIIEQFSECGFCQVTKKCIVNLRNIESLRPYVGGRLLATLVNQEQIVVSRNYAKAVKQKLGI